MRVDGTWLKDDQGRTLMLRGVNLGGSSKLPFTPDGATYRREGLYDHRNVSFVGRPFPLEEADEHFRRLRSWGLTFLRFVVTWEAIEHAGPGLYDEEYLDYLRAVVEKAAEHRIDLFIDPHEDVWSRMCGGDGAPGWTFETIGMDVTQFAQTGAALLHCIQEEPFSHLCWPTNHTKLAAATMFTLFFGGDVFAPETTVDSEPVQGYLQRHYIEALKQVARRLKGLPNVVGYGSMNEPSAGYIGQADLRRWDDRVVLRLREFPTPFQSMLLGSGHAQEVDVYRWRLAGFRRTGRRVVNTAGHTVWKDGSAGVWRANGVWDLDAAGQPRLLRPEHFANANGRTADFANDFLRPFANRFAQEIRSVDPSAIIFVEGVPNDIPPMWGPDDARAIVHAGHWYDGLTLALRRFLPFVAADPRRGKFVLGRGRAQRSREEQLGFLKGWSEREMGGVPTLIGEFGIPINLDGSHAYRTGDFGSPAAALDASYRALDANLLSGTLWNYTADNDNRWGDQWNNEDFSIFSPDQRSNPDDLDSGGRALAAVVRPYPSKTAGRPLRLSFDVRSGRFEYEFEHDPSVKAPTEVFVPRNQYPGGLAVEVSDGHHEEHESEQMVKYYHSAKQARHTIRIGRRSRA